MATKGAATIKDPHFLATCFKHLKQKPEVEFTAVAAELDMSVGGAQNKLRPILKDFEEQGATWQNKSSPVSKPARNVGASTPKRKTAKTKAGMNADPQSSDQQVASTPTKRKAKAVVKEEVKEETDPSESVIGLNPSAEQIDLEGDDAASESPPKKIKIEEEKLAADDKSQ